MTNVTNNIDELSNAALDRRLAELLEPEPTRRTVDTHSIEGEMDGSYVRSLGGAWRCLYSDVTNPRWVPRGFTDDWMALGFLFEKMRERGLYLSLIDGICEYKCVIHREHNVFYRPDRACESRSLSPLKAVARTACKALEKNAEMRMTT